MSGETIGPTVAAAALCLTHVLAGQLKELPRAPRSRWLSAAGGVSVAYVFLHLLPELHEAQAAIGEAVGETMGWVEHHAFVLALAGLAAFYGLERRMRQTEDEREAGDFWLHIGSFAFYNLLIGYTLMHREGDTLALALYTVAMGLHFVVNDYALEQEHRRAYRRRGRWVLAGAVGVGWAAGLAVEIPEAWWLGLLAFLAGGIVLNVLKEELPEDRQSRFSAFLLGVAGFGALLLAL